MSALVFDTAKCLRTLHDAGIPTKHAEAYTQAMSEAFIANTDALVTKDYLDARLEAFEARMIGQFGKVDVKFAEVDGKFRTLYLMNGIIIASLVIPLLQTLST